MKSPQSTEVEVSQPSSEMRRRWVESRQAKESAIGNMPGNSRLDKVFGKIISTTFLASGLYHWGKRNSLAVRLKEIELELPTLPEAFDGYRILHLTDLHLDALPELLEPVACYLEGQEFNLCAMMGDYRESLYASESEYIPHLEALLQGVKSQDGIFATLGNHDSYTVEPALERLGVQVLTNATVRLVRGESCIAVTGVDDPSYFSSDIALEVIRANQHPCNILLAHAPELADDAARSGYALYLTGHTHGGQIAYPGGRPIITRSSCRREMAVDLWREGNMVGYTSCGLGVGIPPVRFNTRGELTVFVLRRQRLQAE